MRATSILATCALAIVLAAPGCGKGGSQKKADDKKAEADKTKPAPAKGGEKPGKVDPTAAPSKTGAVTPTGGKVGTPKVVAPTKVSVQTLPNTKLTITVPAAAKVGKAIIAGADQIKFPGARAMMVVKPRLITDKNLGALEKWAAGHKIQKFEKSIVKTGKDNKYTYIYQVSSSMGSQAVFHQMFQIGGKDFVCFSNADNAKLAMAMKAACDTIKGAAAAAPVKAGVKPTGTGGSGFGAKGAKATIQPAAKKAVPAATAPAAKAVAPTAKSASGFGAKPATAPAAKKGAPAAKAVAPAAKAVAPAAKKAAPAAPPAKKGGSGFGGK